MTHLMGERGKRLRGPSEWKYKKVSVDSSNSLVHSDQNFKKKTVFHNSIRLLGTFYIKIILYSAMLSYMNISLETK